MGHQTKNKKMKSQVPTEARTANPKPEYVAEKTSAPIGEIVQREAYERTYWLHVVSPLHVGAGRGVGHIDLPIVREKVTNWPYVPGSAVKGVIADKYKATEENRKPGSDLAAAFGTASSNGDSQAGSLVFSDASIVCLPVRSFYGTFAWVTSPMALKRLRGANNPDASFTLDDQKVLVLNDNKLSHTINSRDNNVYKVYFEDIDLTVQSGGANEGRLAAWSKLMAESVFPNDVEWQGIFTQRLAVVSDDIFTFFCETGTEVAARIRIDDEKKTVEPKGLWYEESLPTEAILAGVVWCDRVFGNKELKQKDLIDKFCKEPCDLQVGGKASIGKGRVRCTFSGGGQ
jgi:CRISPR-associated protein Cmr4